MENTTTRPQAVNRHNQRIIAANGGSDTLWNQLLQAAAQARQMEKMAEIMVWRDDVVQKTGVLNTRRAVEKDDPGYDADDEDDEDDES